MLRFLSFLSIFYFILISPSCADWCRKQNGVGGIEQCETIPASWNECGSFNGESVWCWPQTNSNSIKSANSNSMKNTLIMVGAGAVFVGVMWYLFKMPPSENNPGQVKLMVF